jgi:hypothetical protein
MHQVALGVSFLHDRGVIHGGRETVRSNPFERQLTGEVQTCTKRNIVFEIPSLDGEPERDAMMVPGLCRRCVPVLTRDETASDRFAP